MKFSRKWTKPAVINVVTQKQFERENLRFLERIGNLETQAKARFAPPDDDEAFWYKAKAIDLDAVLNPVADDYFW